MRSGLEGIEGFAEAEVALLGRAGGADADPPKKSSPRRESFCFGSCFGGSAFTGGGALENDGSVVFGRGGAAGSGSSPNKSTGAVALLARAD